MLTNQPKSRRDFVRNIAFGAGAITLMKGFGIIGAQVSGETTIKAIIIDFSKCSGCRTCETVCSSFNHKVDIGGTMVGGLGNPELSNIRVWHYNPDIDVPVTCFLCADAPCVETCPIEPHAVTGRRALYRDPALQTIVCDYDRCVGCGSCASVCGSTRGGIIARNSETGKPERICTLCGGDPSCVKYCTYGALTFREVEMGAELRNMTPDAIARKLVSKIYEMELVTI